MKGKTTMTKTQTTEFDNENRFHREMLYKDDRIHEYYK